MSHTTNAADATATAMAHVLVLPYPSQGHINPMLQFAKRLASKGPKTTLVTTRFILSSIEARTGAVSTRPISDGYDEGGVEAAPSLDTYLETLTDVGSKSLADLIEEHRSSGEPFTCMVFDTYVPWAVDVARSAGLQVVAFSTQSAAASSIYYYVNKGIMEAPVEGAQSAPVHGLPPLARWEFPSMALRDGSYPTLSGLSLTQFEKVEAEDWVLFNTLEELESEVITGLKEHWHHVKPIGPTVPSMLTDKRLTGDDSYGFNLLKPEEEICLKWLSSQPDRSVVYVSFGSYATLTSDQMSEIASALMDHSSSTFLWVVRASEIAKLPPSFMTEAETKAKGLVVTWCPQLAVLGHNATGCFVTHCGWNSTLEALSLGMAMVAVPQWTDQPTNAKYVEETWGVGLRAKVEEKGVVVRAEELGRCIEEVMKGRKGELQGNVVKWKEVVKGALGEGGSSDSNLNEFVEYLKTVDKTPPITEKI